MQTLRQRTKSERRITGTWIPQTCSKRLQELERKNNVAIDKTAQEMAEMKR